MRQRTITAIFFSLIMLGGIYGGKYSFYALFAIIAGGCAWELGSMIFKAETQYVILRKVLVTSLTLVFYLAVAGDFLDILPKFPIIVLGLVPLLFGILATIELFLAGKNPFQNLGIYFLSVFYIALPLVLLSSIPIELVEGQQMYLPNRVLGLLLLVWTNDTGAYLFGRKFGRHKLFERISPKKTWEGTLGGALFTVLIASGLSFLIPDFSLSQWLALSVVAAIGSNIGDLIESMLKRSAEVKDSGWILPGHGGLLDRFDAFIFCLPFYWMVLKVF